MKNLLETAQSILVENRVNIVNLDRDDIQQLMQFTGDDFIKLLDQNIEEYHMNEFEPDEIVSYIAYLASKLA